MIYLDNSATTRTMDVAAEAAKKYMTEEFFNPAAAYSPAVREERAVNGARKTIGSAINAGPDEIIFTSGGTESNNLALLGGAAARKRSGRSARPSILRYMRYINPLPASTTWRRRRWTIPA